MEQEFQTSFIPKKPLAEERVIRRTGSVSFFNVIAIIIFIAAIAASGGVYFMKSNVTAKIKTAQASLQKAKDEFEIDTVTSLQELDKRLNSSNDLLTNHIVLSPIFSDLAQYTLKTIQFTKFSYAVSGTAPAQQISVKMSGIARDYNALAYQADIFSNTEYFKKYYNNPVFSNLSLNDKNQILFDLTFAVDPNHVKYEKNLPAVPAPQAPLVDPNTTAPTPDTTTPPTDTTNQTPPTGGQ